MAYNDKSFFAFSTDKTASAAALQYKCILSLKEDIAKTYDLVEMVSGDSPLVLSYNASEEFAFTPFRVSSAEINIFYPMNSGPSVPTPETFFSVDENTSWRVQLYSSIDNGATFDLNWQGYLITSDVQFQWQDNYYYRLTATDNLAVLKDFKYSRSDRFAMRPYVTNEGVALIDYIAELLAYTSQDLKIKVACNLKNNDIVQDFENMLSSKFSAIDWEKGEPKDCNKILSNIVKSLGCILYQDNSDATWTILNINEIGTSAGNVVPYRLYDNDGTYLSDGTLDFSDTINIGDDFIWRDKNQFVTFKKPVKYIKWNYAYQRKNLLQNYSFQDNITDIDLGWAETSAITAVQVLAPTIANNYERKYDSVVAVLNDVPVVSSPENLYNTFPTTNTQLNSGLYSPMINEYVILYISYDYFVGDNGFVTGGGIIRNNLILERTGNDYRFVNDSNIANSAAPTGYWTDNAIGYYTEFVQSYGKFTRAFIKTCAVRVSDLQNIILSFSYFKSGGSNPATCVIDNVQMNISSNLNQQLVSIGYFAGVGEFKSNPREEDCEFHGGLKPLDFWQFEDTIAVNTNIIGGYLPETNTLWSRNWETFLEGDQNALVHLALKSILSFYRTNTRVFKGNVYGDFMRFPKYFGIKSTRDIAVLKTIEDEFEAAVIADIGEVETVYCGADFLAEFCDIPAKFLMISCDIDIAKSTTNVVLHEDNTSKIETDFNVGISNGYASGGVFGDIAGGGVNFQQQDIVSG